jgi:antitoxin MazE
MKTHIRKMGNSQGVIIPRLLLEEIGVKAGDTVELKINKKGRLVLTPHREKRRAGWADDSKRLVEAGEEGTALSAGPAGKSFKW